MEPNEKKIWFPAKRYGWGWGPPVCWQGWVVIIVWVLLVAAGAFVLMPHLGWFIPYTAIMCLVLCAICSLKGEKPRWRWGGK